MTAEPRRILHVFPTFAVGGVQVRLARVAKALGPRWRHVVVSLDGRDEAERLIDDPALLHVVRVAHRKSRPIDCLRRFGRALRALQPDLLVTVNWGAIEWAMVNTLLGECRHVHLEEGFGPDEASGQKPMRARLRRLALARAAQVIVPSQTLRRIAAEAWRLPADRVVHLPNGVDVDRFAVADRPAPFRKPPGARVVGAVAPMRAEKNLSRLLRAFAAARRDAPELRLVLVGDGEERPRLEALAVDLGVIDATVFAGHVQDPERYLPHFDVFALSSDTEQMPMTVLEAMAAGRAVVATGVGDVPDMLAAPNRPYVTPRDDEAAFAAALREVACDPGLGAALGAANQARVRAAYSEDAMLRAWADVFDGRDLGDVAAARPSFGVG